MGVTVNSAEFENDIVSLQSQNTNSALKENILTITDKLGFSDIDISVIQGGENVNFMVSSFPSQLHDTYKQEELHINDVVLSYLCTTNKPLFDGSAYDYFINNPTPNAPYARECRRIRELLKDYRFFESYTIPVHEANTKTRFLFTVTQENQSTGQFKKQAMKEKGKLAKFAKTTCKILALRGYTQPRTALDSRELTKRQIGILDMLSSMQITQSHLPSLTGYSRSTVEQDIRDIKDKLGSQSLCCCVRTAARLKLLT